MDLGLNDKRYTGDNATRRVGPTGGKIGRFIPAGTEAVLHTHHDRPLPRGGVLVPTPTPFADTTSLKSRNIPGLVYGASTEKVYETYRSSGNLYFAPIKQDLTLGRCKPIL